MTKSIDVAIIGGGVSGLTTAYELDRLAPGKLTTLLFEASPQLGGTIQTYRENGLVIDAGPDSFVSTRPWAVDLVRELGLESELMSPRPEASRIFIARRGKLKAMPAGMILGIATRKMPVILSRALPLALKIRMLQESFMRPRKPHGEESVAQMFYRHFGPFGVELLADPILGGIYASRADRLSVAACFPQFLEMEAKYGSLSRGIRAERSANPDAPKTPFLTLRSGMHTLIEALAKRLPENTLRLKTSIRSVRQSKDKQTFEIETDSGEVIKAKAVAMATPVAAAKPLLTSYTSLQRTLERFQAVSTATIFLSFAAHEVKADLNGFGFIVPRTELSHIMAATWITSKFSDRAPAESVMMRCFVGGLGREELVSLSEDELVDLCRRELQRWMGIRAQPRMTRVFYWPKLSPQYVVGQARKITQLDDALKEIPGLYLLGNAYRGIGIPDCIREAKKAAGEIFSRLTAN